MTVEAYLKSLVPGLKLPAEVYQRCARSPKEVGFDPLVLSDDVDAHDDEIDYDIRLDYASSTVYYSVLGVFAGGGITEQIGDIRKNRGGYTITMADRERFKMLADALRKKHGFDVETDSTDDNGLFDASYLRYGTDWL